MKGSTKTTWHVGALSAIPFKDRSGNNIEGVGETLKIGEYGWTDRKEWGIPSGDARESNTIQGMNSDLSSVGVWVGEGEVEGGT